MEDATKYLRANAWPMGTELRMLNVPWDSTYENVVAWESAEARDSWFDSQQSESWFSNKFNYLWPNQPIAVPVPYSSAYRYNYVAVTNPAQPVDDEGPVRTYYYFVTDVAYLSPQASSLVVQLDVMTTYADSIDFGQAFVERGHIAMANANVDRHDPYSLYKYLDLPEGLDVGSEYVAVSRAYYDLTTNPDDLESQADGQWIVIVSTASLETDPGTTSSPNLVTATGQEADGMPSGCNVYMIQSRNFTSLMRRFSVYSWVSQCIISIYSLPGRFVDRENLSPVKLFDSSDLSAYKPNDVSPRPDLDPYVLGTVPDMLGRFGVADDEPAKLLTYPYAVIELSCFDGNPIYLKPQFLPTNELQLNAIGCALAPFARYAVYPDGYGSVGHDTSQDFVAMGIGGDRTNCRIQSGQFLDCALWIQGFPQFSIVNNAYITYIASTSSRRWQAFYDAGWANRKAAAQADANLNNAMISGQSAIERSNNLMDYQRYMGGANVLDAAVGGLAGAGSSMTNAAMVAGGGMDSTGIPGLPLLGGAANALGSLALGVYNAEMASGRANAGIVNTSQNARVGMLESVFTAANNYDLATRVRKGDYLQDVFQTLSQIQDAKLTPPTTVGQSGGEGFMWRNNLVGVMVTWKVVDGSPRAAIVDYFRRYGYAVQRWLDLGTLRNMLCMTKFAYWKCVNPTLVKANANESEKETIRGILDRGTTLWDAPESIGATALSANVARPGHSY